MRVKTYTAADYEGYFNLKVMELHTIRYALNSTGGNRPKAAEKLCISLQLLSYKIKKHDIKIKLWSKN